MEVRRAMLSEDYALKRNINDYTIAWISALDIERATAEAVLDERYGSTYVPPGDSNAYSFGRIGSHNIVIAGLPSGKYGTTSAATVAANLLRSFPNIRFGVLVGVGGAVPLPGDLRLGDIVVSYPDRQHGGVVQYDFGTAVQDKKFVINGALDKPPLVLRNAISKMRSKAERRGYDFEHYFDDMLRRYPNMKKGYCRPGGDYLYEADYIHCDSEIDCSRCSPGRLVHRFERSTTGSQVVYGTIGSANSVLRDAILRDKLHKESGIICFEMEAAGLMDNFPCIVIRGISDYADTHKNKHWQRYAGAIAAAFTKELLLTLAPEVVLETPRKDRDFEAVSNKVIANRTKDEQCLHHLQQDGVHNVKAEIAGIGSGSWREADKWVETNDRFRSWRNDSGSQLLCVTGSRGSGKFKLLSSMIDATEGNSFKGTTAVYFFLHVDGPHTAIAVLRGLMSMMIKKHWSLIKYVRKEYDHAGKDLFDNAASWENLLDIFKDMLDDPVAAGTTLFVGGLDRCTVDRDELLQWIMQLARITPTK